MTQKSLLADSIIDFYFTMDRGWKLPPGFELIDPFDEAETRRVFSAFYHKYFADNTPRRFVLGINPGRHGAGVTGVPFTDPKIIAETCGIANDWPKKNELSAVFIYDMIDAYGGPDVFYKDFYINSVCPLGFLTKGINVNYYDDKKLAAAVSPYIVSGIRDQIAMGMRTDAAYCLGNGKNYAYLKKVNDDHHFFDKVVALPHPRWVMQYRRRRKEEFIDNYLKAFAAAG